MANMLAIALAVLLVCPVAEPLPDAGLAAYFALFSLGILARPLSAVSFPLG